MLIDSPTAPVPATTGPGVRMQLVLLAALTVFAAAICLAAVKWTTFGGATAVWPLNALALVALLRGPTTRLWRGGVYLGFIAALIGVLMFVGANWLGAAIVTGMNVIEVGVAHLLLVRFRLVKADMTQPGPLFGLLAVAAGVAPAVAATVAAPVMVWAALGAPVGDALLDLLAGGLDEATLDVLRGAWLESWVTDGLSMMIFVPFGLALTRERLSRPMSARDGLVAAALFLGITLACIVLAPRHPAEVALLSPLAVLATLRFGALGAAASVLWAGALVIGLDLAGLGSVSPDQPGLRAGLFQLQLGLAVLPLVTLPVAAVLAQRDQALRAAATAERARNAFDSAVDAMITISPNGRIESVNAATDAMFGLPKDDVERRDISNLLLLPVRGEEPFLSRLGVSQRDLSKGVVREMTARRGDGATFPVDVALSALELPSGVHVVAVVRDISERRRVETMKEEFVSTVSHELRTPLTSIAGSLGLLAGGMAGALPEKAGRLIGIAHANSQRLVRLINDILDIEKMESGNLLLENRPLDLRHVAERSIEGVRGYADELGVRIAFRAGAEEIGVRGDEDRLIQVVTNLLSNACKFSPPGEEIVVAVEGGERVARLSVSDRGPGVPEAFRSRIFTKFAQADSSDTRAKGGTGLGLAIAREIAERHGGRLWFDAAVEQGATFLLELPVRDSAAPALSPTGPRLLIVEDDPDAAAVLREVLESDGLAADVASTGQAAFNAAQAGGYAAILVDLQLPDMDGISLIRSLRARSATRDLPVVVVSANVADGKVRGGSLQVVDWMEKPFDQGRLREVVAGVLSRGAAVRPQVLHVEDDADIHVLTASVLADVADVKPARNLAEARAALLLRFPDLVILDIGLPDGCGIDLLADLEGEGGTDVPVVIYSAREIEPGLADRVEAALTKSRTSMEGLAQTVRRIIGKQTGGAA